jgi:hypothetical protein
VLQVLREARVLQDQQEQLVRQEFKVMQDQPAQQELVDQPAPLAPLEYLESQ